MYKRTTLHIASGLRQLLTSRNPGEISHAGMAALMRIYHQVISQPVRNRRQDVLDDFVCLEGLGDQARKFFQSGSDCHLLFQAVCEAHRLVARFFTGPDETVHLTIEFFHSTSKQYFYRLGFYASKEGEIVAHGAGWSREFINGTSRS